MSRYIDADDVANAIYHHFPSIRTMADARSIIDEAPSIDIVRCKECKYWENSQYYQEFMVCAYVKGATFTRQHDDFCSRGERREP